MIVNFLRVRPLALAVLIVAVCLAGALPIRAQDALPYPLDGLRLDALAMTIDAVPAGSFRGTLVAKDTAVSPIEPPRQLVSGTATWRFEMDSLDWRRKLTIRIALSGPDHASYVVRMAGAEAPHEGLVVRNTADSHSDPRYFMAKLSVRDHGISRVYDHWFTGFIKFHTPISVAPGSVIAGALHMDDDFFHDRVASTRKLNGSFSARFDPRPEPATRNMTADLQTKILKSALWEFTSTWVQHKFHIMPADSVFDAKLARAYIANRFGESLTVDSVSTDYNAYFVRVRGKYLPIVCTMSVQDENPVCKDKRSLRARFFGGKSETQ